MRLEKISKVFKYKILCKMCLRFLFLTTFLLSLQVFCFYMTCYAQEEPIVIDSKIKHVIVMIVDGLKKDVLYEVLDSPYFADVCPTLIEYFKTKPNIRLTNVLSTFPTVTFSANASIVTGNYPRKHGIPGNKWMNRIPTKPETREYTELHVWPPGRDLVRVYTEGLSTKDLAATFVTPEGRQLKTVYDYASVAGRKSTISYHMYSTCGNNQMCNPITPMIITSFGSNQMIILSCLCTASPMRQNHICWTPI